MRRRISAMLPCMLDFVANLAVVLLGELIPARATGFLIALVAVLCGVGLVAVAALSAT